MGWRNCIVLMSGICLLADFVSAPASAQTRVGQAAVIKNQVHRVAGSAASQISVGDSVVRDEVVRTGVDSAARLVMADSTNLSLGPNATITLDRTVFNDEHSYREIAIRLATGAFRFVTGHSEKTAYKINTSLATIGVRGTVLDVLSQSVLGNGQGTHPTPGLPSKQVIVVLQEGAARVCTLGGQCVELTEPGQSAIITSTGGKVTIQKTNSPPWTFASNCGAAAGLCTVTNFADATPPSDGSDPTGMLCGR
jgi:ferric-dicitrate binding protein FerR (iron transport regulator)